MEKVLQEQVDESKHYSPQGEFDFTKRI